MREPRTIVFPVEGSDLREARAKRVMTFLSGLDPKRTWEVVVRPFKRIRSNQQSRYERGVACVLLSQETGYEPEEIHEYLCGTYWGWKQVQCPKTPSNPKGLRDVPLRTTTVGFKGERDVLSKTEFVDFVAFIQRFGAQHGILIPDPDPELAYKDKAA